jgi:diguanylate cyclase (GGDEF)-like protein
MPLQACSASPDDLAALLKLACDFRWELDTALRFSALAGPLIERGAINPDSLLKQRLSNWPAHLLRESSPTEIALAALLARQAFRDLECLFELTDHSRHWFSLSGVPRHNHARQFGGFQGIAIDISQKREEEERYRHLAYHDTLTGLPNRRLFTDRLEHALRQARREGSRLALMMIDLDHFKTINDHFGHAAGDRALMTLANTLRMSLRQSDTVARLGGDEFAALLPRVGSDQDVLRVARKLQEALQSAGPFQQSASIGIALYPDHGIEVTKLLMMADQAMYVVKRKGGGSERVAPAKEVC